MRIKNITYRPAIIKRVLLLIIIKIFIVLVALYGALFIFINTKGKSLAISKIKSKYGLEAQIDTLVFKLPFNFEITNFKCGGLAFKKAKISFSLLKPLNFPLDLNSVFIDGLQVKLTKDKFGWALDPFTQKDRAVTVSEKVEVESVPDAKSSIGKKQIHFSVQKFVCRNASVDIAYTNRKKRIVPIKFDEIDFEINDFVYPRLSIFSFDLDAYLISPDLKNKSKSNIKIKGWADFLNKNIDASVNVNDYDYMAFISYYPEVWKPKNLGIEEAILFLDVTLKSKNNDLVMDLLVLLERVVFSKMKEESSGARVKIIKNTIEHFRKGNEKPQYRFKTRTKMDSPEQFLPALLRDLRSNVPIGPAIIAEAVIEKTQETISKTADQVFERTKETITKGAEGVKKLTVDVTLGTIDKTVDTLKDIIFPVKEEENNKDQLKE